MDPSHRPHALRTASALLALLLLMTGTPAAHAQHPVALRRLELAGAWHYLPYNGPESFAGAEVDHSGWPTMRLPSSWFLLGSDDYPSRADRPVSTEHDPGGLWPVDPERGLDWAGTVWFRRAFEWQGDGRLPVVLELDMVDYYAEVFVNGAPVGRHEGYFQAWSLDVTRALRPGRNVVAVKVSAPALVFDMAAQYPVSWPKHQDQVKGIFAYHDTRPGATTHRGQERPTGGILRGIALRESTGVEIEALHVTPLEVSERSARLVVEAVVRNRTAEPVSVLLGGMVTPKNFSDSTRLPLEVRLTAPPGASRARAELSLRAPRLWWSWDYGEPNLYRLDARLADARTGGALDYRAETFGVRSVSVDEQGVWHLNGKRIYPRGSNYIGTHWLSQADRRWYDRDLALARGANLNSIRVHAHVARPELYAAADSAGIMVWQDFPLQWGYTDRPEFHREAVRQLGDMVRRLYNHPSVIVWSMHNEPPWAMEWMRKRDPDQNRALDHALLAEARRLDSTRVGWLASGVGDAHPYPGWYGGSVADFATLPEVPLVTEYGAQALPDLSTLRRTFAPDSVWPRDPSAWAAWRYHDFQPEQTFRIAGVPKGDSIEEFVRNSQRYQAALIRFATESFRRAKWRGSTGIYHFMLTDGWPGITWSVVDYWRNPKPGYHALRSSMRPVLASIEYRIDDPDAPLALHVVNDLHRPLAGALVRWRTVAADGTPGPVQSRRVDVPADAAVRVAELGALPEATRGGGRLEAWIEHGREWLGWSSLGAADFLPADPE